MKNFLVVASLVAALLFAAFAAAGYAYTAAQAPSRLSAKLLRRFGAKP